MAFFKEEYFNEKLDELIGISSDNTSAIQIEKYPQYLYKYKNCDKKHNFDMIEFQYLWADIPQNFDDPSDSLIHMKILSEYPEIQKWWYDHIGELLYYNLPPKGMQKSKNGQTLRNYVDAQKHFLNEEGKYDAKKAQKIMLLEIKKLPYSMQQEAKKLFKSMESEEFERKMEKAVCGTMDTVVNTLRNNIFICCLTKRKDNQKMWEEYAKKYSGFVIEYDLSKCDKATNVTPILKKLFPVKYYKRFPKVSLLPFLKEEFYRVFYKRETNIDEDKKKLYNQLFIKKIEYNGEEEWRIVAQENKIPFPIISAIYMGYKINICNEEKLRKICEKQKLSLYKQYINPITGELKFKQILKEGVSV